MPKPEQTNQETIPGYTSAELEIIKEIQEDGAVVFKHPAGGKVETYRTDLYSFNYEWFSQLQALVEMLGDDEYDPFGSTFEVLIRYTKSELDEAHSFKSWGHPFVPVVEQHPLDTYRETGLLKTRSYSTAPLMAARKSALCLMTRISG